MSSPRRGRPGGSVSGAARSVRPAPVLSAADYAAAEPLARAFGWASAWQALTLQAPPRPGRILAWESEAWDAACLLAGLTGREPLRSVSGQSEWQDIDLVVGRAASIDDRLVERLLELDRPSAIGLVLGRDAVELRARVVATAVAARSDPASIPRRLVLQPDWPLASDGSGLLQVFGATAAAAEVRGALRAGDTLVTLAGHGDGIDAELAGGLVLCPKDADFLSLGSARRPLCRLTGKCYRLEIEAQGEMFRHGTLHPGEILARALVWNSCVGWPAREGFIDRAYGVGLRLAVSGRIGAVVTTERVVMAPRDITEPLVASVLRGMALGHAVARHNASPEARRYGHRLLLFGDPACRIAPPQAELNRFPSQKTMTKKLGTSRQASIALSGSDRDVSALLAVLLTGSPAEMSRNIAWTRLQEHMKTGTLEGFWARTADRIAPATAPRECPYCGLATTNHALSTRQPVPQQRIVRVCPRCEVISDKAVGESLEIRIGRGHARLLGRRPSGPWRATLILRQRWPYASRTIPWPRDPAGRLERSVHWESDPDDAPVMASVVAHGLKTLAIFSRALAAPQRQPTPAA